jgi:hypothetical protein
VPPGPRLPSGRKRPRILSVRMADGCLYFRYSAASAVVRYRDGTGMVDLGEFSVVRCHPE